MRFNFFALYLTLGILTQSCSIINAAIPVLLRPTSPPASSLPVVRDVLPSSGPVGTRVTISGANLGSVVSVSFGDQSTLPVSRNATTVVVIVPEGATSGRITVNTPTESAKSQTIFTVTASPTVDEVFPRSGPVGTNVTITGQNLENARSVQFGGVSAPIVAKFPTQIIARVPSGAQSGPIIVLSDGPAARSRESFEVTQPARAPVISDFTPQSGRA